MIDRLIAIPYPGPPKRDTYVEFDAVIDSEGVVWVNNTAGTPGSWTKGSSGGGGGGLTSFMGRTTPAAVFEGSDLESLFSAAGQMFLGTGNGTGEIFQPGTGTEFLRMGGADPSGVEWAGLTKADVTGTGLAASDIGADPIDGWVADANTWTYSSVGGHTSVLTVNADLTGKIGLGYRIKLTNNSLTQYFIVTAISVLSGTTTITLYGGAVPVYLNASYTNAGGAQTSITVKPLAFPVPNGASLIFANGDIATVSLGAAAGATSISIQSTTPSTTNGGWSSGSYVNASNYVLANAAITNPFYSHAKVPFGFISDPSLWSEMYSDIIEGIQTTPTANTYYNLNGVSLLVPIGSWVLTFMVAGRVVGGSATAGALQIAVSTSASSASDPELIVLQYISGSSITTYMPINRSKNLQVAAATTYFMIALTLNANTTSISFEGARGNTIIRATCAYL